MEMAIEHEQNFDDYCTQNKFKTKIIFADGHCLINAILFGRDRNFNQYDNLVQQLYKEFLDHKEEYHKFSENVKKFEKDLHRLKRDYQILICT